jgi:Zn-dependent protease
MELVTPHRTYKIGPFYSSEIEIIDLAKAWIAISAAFAIVLGGAASILTLNFIYYFIISAITVGLGFILHEMGHKVVAQRYGCFAEFRADNMMLIFAVALSFLGFVFAAPGAVMIAGHHVDRKRLGHIGAAGPIMSLLLAVIFFVLGFFHPNIIFTYGFMINSWIALFNMIPFGMFDGYKIFNASKAMWMAMTAVAVFMTFFVGRI